MSLWDIWAMFSECWPYISLVKSYTPWRGYKMHKVPIIPCLLGGVPCFCCIFSFYSHLCWPTDLYMGKWAMLLTTKATACLQNFIGAHPISFFPIISSWKWCERECKICFFFFLRLGCWIKRTLDNILQISRNTWLDNNNCWFIIKVCAIQTDNTQIMK